MGHTLKQMHDLNEMLNAAILQKSEETDEGEPLLHQDTLEGADITSNLTNSQKTIAMLE